jgi:hypothetical protein
MDKMAVVVTAVSGLYNEGKDGSQEINRENILRGEI